MADRPMSTDTVMTMLNIHTLPTSATIVVSASWFADGDPVTIQAGGMSQFSGLTIHASLTALDAIETMTICCVDIDIDQHGSGMVIIPGGLSLNRHCAVFIQDVEVNGDLYHLAGGLFSIANSPTPGGDGAKVLAEALEIDRKQTTFYSQPLGDKTIPGIGHYRGVSVIEGIRMGSILRIPGATIEPISECPNEVDRATIVNNVLERLGWDTQISLNEWISVVKADLPMAIVVCPHIYASSNDEADTVFTSLLERVISLLSLNRQATGHLVAEVMEQLSLDGTVLHHLFRSGRPHYQGNLLIGSLAGEGQRSFVSQYLGVEGAPLVQLCASLYGEAIAERSFDAKYFRLWSIIELLARATISSSQLPKLIDGSPWPIQNAKPTSAVPCAYAYIASILKARNIDELSMVVPAVDLYEAINVWYSRRNATGHYGRFIVNDGEQKQQKWYISALKSIGDSTHERSWLEGLRRSTEMAIHYELAVHAPKL